MESAPKQPAQTQSTNLVIITGYNAERFVFRLSFGPNEALDMTDTVVRLKLSEDAIRKDIPGGQHPPPRAGLIFS